MGLGRARVGLGWEGVGNDRVTLNVPCLQQQLDHLWFYSEAGPNPGVMFLG